MTIYNHIYSAPLVEFNIPISEKSLASIQQCAKELGKEYKKISLRVVPGKIPPSEALLVKVVCLHIKTFFHKDLLKEKFEAEKEACLECFSYKMWYAEERLTQEMEAGLLAIEYELQELKKMPWGFDLQKLEICILKCLNLYTFNAKVFEKAWEKYEVIIPEKSLIELLITHSPNTALRLIDLLKIQGKDSLVLYSACLRGWDDLVEKMLSRGVNPDILTPLTACLEARVKDDRQGICRSFDLLIQAGADPNCGTFHSAPILSACLLKGFEDWAWQIYQKCDLEKQSKLGATPLHYAVRLGYEDLAIEFLKNGANPNAFARENMYSMRKITPLYIAVGGNRPRLLKALIKQGGDPHLKALNHCYRKSGVESWAEAEPLSPYMLAVDLGHDECLDVICKFARPTLKDLENEIVREPMTTMSEARRGYLSFEDNLRVEAMKRATRLETSIPCYTNDIESSRLAKLMITYFVDRELKGAKFICNPICDLIQREFTMNKKFGIYFSKSIQGESEIYHGGHYNSDTRNSVTISIHMDLYVLLGTFFHELTHKSADMLFSKCSPPIESGFEKLCNEDIMHLKAMQDPLPIIQDLFLEVEKIYRDNQWTAEYLARIPQAAIHLAFRYGLDDEGVRQVMGRHLPNLFPYFTEVFLPLCSKQATNPK